MLKKILSSKSSKRAKLFTALSTWRSYFKDYGWYLTFFPDFVIISPSWLDVEDHHDIGGYSQAGKSLGVI
jgi:hypothetical protein